jgi:hypothetical protein
MDARTAAEIGRRGIAGSSKTSGVSGEGLIVAHALDGARLKIVRAEEQLQLLKDEIARYLDSKPYEFPVEDHGNAVMTAAAIIKEDPPLRLGCIFGSVRASLDYIAWELASLYAKPKPVVGRNRDISFPIVDDPGADGAKRLAKMAKKYAFSADSVTEIQSVQPHNAGYEILRFLSDFVNTDKHCVPLMVLATANTAWIEFQHPESSAVVGIAGGGGMIIRKLAPADLDESGRQSDESRRRDLAMLHELLAKARDASGPHPPTQQTRTVKVDGQVTIFVSLKNSPMPSEPVERQLEQIIKCVANVVPRFDKFFV